MIFFCNNDVNKPPCFLNKYCLILLVCVCLSWKRNFDLKFLNKKLYFKFNLNTCKNKSIRLILFLKTEKNICEA